MGQGGSSALCGNYGKNEGDASEKRKSLNSSAKKAQDKELYIAITGSSREDGSFEPPGEAGQIQEFLNRGCRPIYKDNEGHTAIHQAASRGNVEILTLLLDAFPEHVDILSGHKNTPLTMAIMSERKPAIALLVRRGAKNAFFHLAKGGANGEIFNFVFAEFKDEFGDEMLKELIRVDNKTKMTPQYAEAVPTEVGPFVSNCLGF